MRVLLVCALLVACALAHNPNDPPYEARPGVVWPPVPDREVLSQFVEYREDPNNSASAVFQGFIAFPKDARRALPGLLLAHQFFGLGPMERFRAREFAAYGYVVFAADFYGRGVRPVNQTEAIAFQNALLRNPQRWWNLTLRAIDVLKNAGVGPRVDATKLLAGGYCGGAIPTMEIARRAVPGFVALSHWHPVYVRLFPNATYSNNITAAVQAHHANLDGSGDAGLSGFENEMRTRFTPEWSTHKYGARVNHGWTDPTNVNYNANAAAASHASARQFFGLVLGTISTDGVHEDRSDDHGSDDDHSHH